MTSPRFTAVLEEARSGRYRTGGYIVGRASPPAVPRRGPERPGAAHAR